MNAGCSGFTLATCASSQARSASLPGLAHRLVGHELVVREGEQGRVVHHHDAAQRRQPLGKRQDAVDVLLVLGNEQHRAAVAHLVFDLFGRGRRIDAVDDGAERLRGLVADQPLLAHVGHDGDAVAGCESLGRKRLGRAGNQLGVLPPRPLAIDAALLGAEGDCIGLRCAPAPAAAPAPWCGAGRRRSAACWRVRRMTRTAASNPLRVARARPLAIRLANSAATRCMSLARSASRQLMTALHMPSTASMASRASASGADAAVGDAGQDHVLEEALDAAALAPDAAAAGRRQVAAFVDEHLDVVGHGLDRREMGGDQPRELVERRASRFPSPPRRLPRSRRCRVAHTSSSAASLEGK